MILATKMIAPRERGGGAKIASVMGCRRPILSGWKRWRSKMVELINAIHAFPSDNSQHRFQALDLLFGDGKIVFGEHCKICELTGSEHTLRILFRREPTTPVCIQPESLFTRQAILFA